MQQERAFFAYILASKPHGTLYIGVTNTIYRRMIEHREGKGGSFTRKHKVNRLMWFEPFTDIHVAIQREKSLKLWPRAWKINRIERDNPHWQDLFPAMSDRDPAPGTP